MPGVFNEPTVAALEGSRQKTRRMKKDMQQVPDLRGHFKVIGFNLQ